MYWSVHQYHSPMTGAQIVVVPYKGAPQATTDVVGGQVQLSLASAASSTPHIQSGKLRALAVTATRRVAALPDMPAVAEALPGFEVIGWYGVIGPANLPRPIVTRLHGELVKILNQPDVRERIINDGSEPVGSSPDDFRQFMLADMDTELQAARALLYRTCVLIDMTEALRRHLASDAGAATSCTMSSAPIRSFCPMPTSAP